MGWLITNGHGYIPRLPNPRSRQPSATVQMRYICATIICFYPSFMTAHEPTDGIKFVKVWKAGSIISALFENTTTLGAYREMSCVAFDQKGNALAHHIHVVSELATTGVMALTPPDVSINQIADIKCEYTGVVEMTNEVENLIDDLLQSSN